MREAVHIFLKDSRYLRFPIAVILAWTAIFLVASASALQPLQRIGGWSDAFGFVVPSISRYVLPIGWWFLISRAFHADAIPGDRQFWLTRPYSRASLFGAKVLFVLAYIAVPFALAQIAVVMFRGFPLGPSILGVLWSQVMILAIIVLPAAALAAVTSKLTQFVVAGLTAPLLFLIHNELVTPWGALDWIRASIAICIVFTVTSTVLFVQFTRRRTGVSRFIAAAGIVAVVTALALAPWRTAFALQSRVAADWTGNLTAELVRLEPSADRGSERMGRLLVQIAGLPARNPIACEATELTIKGQGGIWETGLSIGPRGAVSTASNGCMLVVSDPLVRQVGSGQASIHATLYITVFGAERSITVPIDQPPTIVPDAGLCAGITHRDFVRLKAEDVERRWVSIGCQSAFRDPRRLILFSPGGSLVSRGRFSYSPFPADLRIPPVEEAAFFTSPQADAITVVTQEPVAHVKAVVDVQDVYLQDFLR